MPVTIKQKCWNSKTQQVECTDIIVATPDDIGGNENLCYYEKIAVWAEESTAISTNQQEWSFGNGATGQIGIPLAEDWEIYAIGVHADVATGVATIIVREQNAGVDIPGTSITTIANQETTISTLTTPIPLSVGNVIGFRTVSVTGGSVSDVRVAVYLRRKAKLIAC